MRILFTLLFFWTCFNSFGQDKLTPEQVKEDFGIFRNVLLDAHPALYAYTPKEKWDSLFQLITINSEFIKSPSAVYKTVCNLAAHVGDGHLKIMHPNLDSIPHLFPILLKNINGKMYVDYSTDLPVGCEIRSINGRPMAAILQGMNKYATSDGYVQSMKDRKIETEFSFLYFLEFGADKRFSISYITTEGQDKQLMVNPIPFDTLKKINVNRHSYFWKQHQVEPLDHFKTHVQANDPFLYFIDSVNTAVLTVNSFAGDPRGFKSNLVDIFKCIKKKKTKQLIIDIRNNIGGYRVNAIHLYSFLTATPFKQRVSEEIIPNYLPEPKYIVQTLSEYKNFVNYYKEHASQENNRMVLYEDRQQDLMVPAKKTFDGSIAVLIGGKTFSAANAFALNAYQNSSIKLFGEETGGGYYFHTGQYPVVYQLPHSKVAFYISLVKVNHFVNDSSITHGSGILPDIKATLNVEDLIKGEDTGIKAVLDYFKDQNKP